MIDGRDLNKLTCIHRKHFDDIGLANEGTVVTIYYKYNDFNKIIVLEDYSIQFIVDGKLGNNVADKEDFIPNEIYEYLFKTTYKELHDHILTQIK
ncbi:hypothetical protein N9273_00400 [bacterium]|nr:hypothetical protein [bacterium]